MSKVQNTTTQKQEKSIAEKAHIASETEQNESCVEQREPTAQERVWADIYRSDALKLELKLSHADLYQFLMYHSYCNVTGVLATLLSIYCLIQGSIQIAGGETDSMTAILLLVGVWFLIINPVSMLGKTVTQMKTNATLSKPITYWFTENGMLQEQGEVRTGCKWNLITKAVFMKRIWVLYAGKVRGTILPVAQLGEHREELRALIKAHTGKK